MSGNLTPYHTYEEGNALPTVNPTGTHSSADQLAMSSKLVGGKKRKSRSAKSKSGKIKAKSNKRKTRKNKSQRRKK